MLELSKNQIHTAKIEGYSSSGAGVCRIGGRAVFVRHALLGETWEVLILKVSRSAVYGKGLRLIEPSPQRRVSPCPVFGTCGGCDLMHMSYEEELRFKLNRVNDAIKHIAGLDFTINEILGAREDGIYRYRNKAIFNIALDKNGHTRTGFFRERSHELVPASDCLIQSEVSLRCAEALCAFMDKHKLLPYEEESGEGLIKNLFVRSSVHLPYCLACIVAVKGLGKHTKALVDAL
jgi:23S rRNA (uracil1939-C5)-methyltransferase